MSVAWKFSPPVSLKAMLPLSPNMLVPSVLDVRYGFSTPVDVDVMPAKVYARGNPPPTVPIPFPVHCMDALVVEAYTSDPVPLTNCDKTNISRSVIVD